MILSIIAFVISCWLLFTVIKVSLKVAWCLAKVIAVVLCVAAIPLLILIAITMGGILLLVPIGMLVGAWCAVKAC